MKTGIGKRLTDIFRKIIGKKESSRQPDHSIPRSLTLEFSKAADYARVDRIFDPKIKDKIDPNNFVVKRDDKVLREALSHGGGCFLAENTGNIFTMTIAYHIRKDKAAGGKHDYTEIGTSLARVGGYNSAQLVIAALALKEWWENAPKNMIVTEILPNNVPSLKTSYALGWEQIKDKATVDELHKLCNEIIAPEDKGRQTIWFGSGNSTLKKQAQTILKFIDQGGLINKKTGHKISVDFTALDKIGLSRGRVEAIARGVIARDWLQQRCVP